uniref:protein-serine/threonine phosphatase n=1 Tax=Wollemia nobilis TaxID=56998 RepID=A0A0C9RMK6_9CONI
MISKVEEESMISSKPKGKREFLSRLKMAAGFTPSSSDKGKGRSKLPNKGPNHGFHLVKGKSRHDMEDYHVAEYRHLNDHDLGLFAIFDGHLGHKVPCYLQSNLFNNILKEPGFWTEPEKAIKSAYRQTDEKILSQTAELGPGGSTAVTAILIDGRQLFVANVGDSRAVLCQGGTAIQLTVDHEPSLERKDIERKGGFVTNLPGDVPRVNGQLAVARAFGDGSLKQHLSSEPDVKQTIIDTTTDFLILASDGLWKVMKNQEAVDLVRKIRDPQVAAKCLTETAVSRKSKDDISCIVVRFQN